jgi:DNA modification methylase
VEPALNTIHNGDCVEGLRQLPAESVDLAFADPPFNIGYDYDVYDDKKDHERYLNWTRQWMRAVHRVLKAAGTFWLAIGDEYAAEMKLIAQDDLKFTCRSWVIWYYTFGVNCTKKFTRSHAHLFHFVKDASKFTFNEDEIAVPSARQLVYDDGRAHPAGRLPDDTWILRPQDLPDGFTSEQATWYFPRVAGTFKQRAGFHGCQMPEQLLGRIIRTSSNPGEIVLDPFAGSGTTLVAAKKLGRRVIGFELSAEYTKQASQRLAAAVSGLPLEGAAEPIVSAPRTPGKTSKDWLRAGVNRALIEAYLIARASATAEEEVARRYHAECLELGLPGKAADWDQELTRLRKQGLLRFADKKPKNAAGQGDLGFPGEDDGEKS